jgi:hypothetical protein
MMYRCGLRVQRSREQSYLMAGLGIVQLAICHGERLRGNYYYLARRG